MSLHNDVGQRCSPFQSAHREDREPPVFGQITHTIGIIALALPAQAGDPVRGDPGQEILWKVKALEIFQSIHQPVGGG